MFETQIPALEIAARTFLVYAALLIGIRLAGKREMGQLTAFDFVVILLVANAVQNAMTGPDTSVTGGLIAAVVLLGANYVLAFARDHVPWLQRSVEGTPTLLIHDGAFLEENLSHEGVNRDEVLMAIREHGLTDVSQVQMAVLENDGAISVVPMGSERLRTRHRLRYRKH
jgi:uncharacterized membrane protein YcaP (DUF421 family)